MTQPAYIEVKSNTIIEAVNYNAHWGYGNGQEKVLVQKAVAEALERIGAELHKEGLKLHVFEGAITPKQYEDRYNWAVENIEVDPTSYDSCCVTESQHKAKLLKPYYESVSKYDNRYETGLYVTVGICDVDGNVLPRPNMFEETVMALGLIEWNTDEEYQYKSKLKQFMEEEGFTQVSDEKWYEFKYTNEG